jgi:hypothetical protein
MESKQYITHALYDLLTLTREYSSELVRLDYIKSAAEEVVVAEFISGSTKTINVHMDSGIALIKDVLRGLEEGEWDH